MPLATTNAYRLAGECFVSFPRCGSYDSTLRGVFWANRDHLAIHGGGSMSNPELVTTDRPAAWSSRHLVVTLRGPKGKQVFTVEKPFARVGAHPQSEVVLPDGPAKRLFLHASDTGIFCLSLENTTAGRPAFTGWMSPRRAIAVGAYLLTARFADDSSGAVRGRRGGGEERETPAAIESGPGEGDSGQEHSELGGTGQADSGHGDSGLGDSGPLDSDQQEMPGTEPVRIATPAGAQLELTNVKGRRQTVQLRLRRPLTIVGREPPSKLCLADTSISRAHCILYWDDARLWAIDLFSANGMRIDGRPVEFGVVPPGSGLILGNILLKHLSGTEGPATPPSDWEPEAAGASPPTSAAPGSDTQVLAVSRGRSDGPNVDGTADSVTDISGVTGEDVRAAGGEGRLEPLAVDTPCSSEQFDRQRFQTPAPDTWEATVDEFRREAQQQAEEWAERRDTLLAELATVRAELADVKRERDEAKTDSQQRPSYQHELRWGPPQTKVAPSEPSAEFVDFKRAHSEIELKHGDLEQKHSDLELKLSELEVVHRELELKNRDLERAHGELEQAHGELDLAHVALKEQLAEALNREEQLRLAAEQLARERTTEVAVEWHAESETEGAAPGETTPFVPQGVPPDDEAGLLTTPEHERSRDEAKFGAASADEPLTFAGSPDEVVLEDGESDDVMLDEVALDEEARVDEARDDAAQTEALWNAPPRETELGGDIDDLEMIETPFLGALVPVPLASQKAGAGVVEGVVAEHDRSSALVPRKRSVTKTSALGDDELFDQLVSAQARHSRHRGRNRLLAMSAIGVAVLLALAVAGYFAWQPLMRALDL